MNTDNEIMSSTAKPVRARRVIPAADPSSKAVSTTPSKSDTVIKLLLRAKGATSVELIAATEWQPHSVRAFLSGLRKKERTIVREARKSGEFAYRILVTMDKMPPTPVANEGAGLRPIREVAASSAAAA